jgi:hypothetical protein
MISLTMALMLQQWPHATCSWPRLEKFVASLALNVERIAGCRMKGKKSCAEPTLLKPASCVLVVGSVDANSRLGCCAIDRARGGLRLQDDRAAAA